MGNFLTRSFRIQVQNNQNKSRDSPPHTEIRNIAQSAIAQLQRGALHLRYDVYNEYRTFLIKTNTEKHYRSRLYNLYMYR